MEAGGESRVDVRGCGGPDAPLLAPAQALALHELNTNALKHDASAASGGRVSVRCHADPGGGARVVERVERGGPPIAAACPAGLRPAAAGARARPVSA